MILFITPRPDVLSELPADTYFRGAYHSYFWHCIYDADLPARQVKMLFLDQYDETKLTKEIDIIVPLGKECWHLFDKLSLDKARGSIFIEKLNKLDRYLIPTFHPEELKFPYRLFMDDSIEKSYCFRADLGKINYVLKNGYRPLEERFNLAPNIEQVRQFVDEAIDRNYLLGTDIEATGLNIEYAQIVCIGFAWSAEDCIVVPLTKERGVPYWTGSNLREINNLLNKLFKHGRFLFQNGIGYDVPLLRQRGFKFPLTSFTDDTMLLHHALSPELPHNIGFISSFYGQQPYWKESFLTRREHIFDTDQIKMRQYNARDCVALKQIYEPLLSEVKRKELEDVYRLSMDLCPAIIEMQETGIKIDPVKLKSWQNFLNREIKKKFNILNKLKPLPDGFNYASGDHLTWLLYGIKPPSFSKIFNLVQWEPHVMVGYRCTECNRKINEKYLKARKPYNTVIDHKCPRCKEVKKFKRTDDEVKLAKPKVKNDDYKKLINLKEIMKVKTFKPPRHFNLSTTKTGYATDKVAITKYIIAINKRLDELEHLKRRSPIHAKEDEALNRTKTFLIALQEYNALNKLKSSFYHFKTWRDGRVRPKILIQGTATGRFSCKEPNLQQMPAHGIGSKMRNIFCAGEGKTLLSIDFSNLEVQVGARFMNDKKLINILENGKNMHDENTKTFFNVKKSDKQWSDLRFAAKKIMFGRLLYGGSDQGIYTKVMTEVPKCGLTLKKFKEAVANYMSEHPDYVLWTEEMIKLAHDNRVSINAYGRKRLLYGDSRKIERQALNTPIQGSSADTINLDIVLIYKELLKRKLKSKLILAVHDELIFECLNEELKEVYEMAREIMTRERSIKGHKFSIPIDAEIGQYWGSLGKFNAETMDIIGGSKH